MLEFNQLFDRFQLFSSFYQLFWSFDWHFWSFNQHLSHPYGSFNQNWSNLVENWLILIGFQHRFLIGIQISSSESIHTKLDVWIWTAWNSNFRPFDSGTLIAPPMAMIEVNISDWTIQKDPKQMYTNSVPISFLSITY